MSKPLNLLSTIKGSLLENFYPAGWNLKKIDKCCAMNLSQLTRPASSSPAMVGSACASAINWSAAVPSVASTPRNAPTHRKCRTSARVSISQMTGTFHASR